MIHSIEKSEHAKFFSASSSERWVKCPGSVKLESEIKEDNSTSSIYALEGTAAHFIAEKSLSRGINPDFFLGHTVKFDEYSCVKVTEEMTSNVLIYVNFVRKLEETCKLFIEQKVNYEHIAQGGFGTSDAIGLDISNNKLHIIDFKYGKGVLVSSKYNYQLMLYALGAISELQWLFIPSTIELHICQPRINSQIDSFTIAYEELKRFENTFKNAAEIALSGDVYFTSDSKICRFCKAKDICDTYKVTKNSFNYSGDNSLSFQNFFKNN